MYVLAHVSCMLGTCLSMTLCAVCVRVRVCSFARVYLLLICVYVDGLMCASAWNKKKGTTHCVINFTPNLQDELCFGNLKHIYTFMRMFTIRQKGVLW